MNLRPPPVDNPVQRESYREPMNSVRRLAFAFHRRLPGGRNPSANARSLTGVVGFGAAARFKTARRQRREAGGKNFPQRNSFGQGKTS
jgi:hypothetical protein